MFMAAISNWLEMGFASSSASTSSASASGLLVPSSGRALSAWDSTTEDAAGLAEDAVEEEAAPPQPASRAQPSVAATADSISFERIFIDYSFFCIHYTQARRCAFRRGWPGHCYLTIPLPEMQRFAQIFTVSSPVFASAFPLSPQGCAAGRCSPRSTGRWR